ncbi:MAG: hypothetical protein GQ558_10290 [Thermoplasmata archaeon]|nr:hypothetical protein [Thermoplasmata archaeon]
MTGDNLTDQPEDPEEGPDQPEPSPPPSPMMDEPDTIQVDVEAAFPEIRRLKLVGALLFVMAGLSAILPIILLTDTDLDARTLVAVALAASGIAVGIAGLVSPGLRRPAIMAAPIIIVAAAAAGSPGVSLDSIPPLELALAFIFGLSLLLAIEHLHAVMRFVELGAYVTRQRLTAFRISNVVDHFQIYGVALVTLITLVTAIVVVGVPWVFAQGSDASLGRSVELNSVFGMALAAAVVFSLSAIILVFVRTVIPQRVEVERVAYSRDRMEDMLSSSRSMENRQGEGIRKGGA